MSVEALSREHGPTLHCPTHIDGAILLMAIASVESSSGTYNIPRYEPAYGYKGYYYRRAQHVRDLWWKYGDHAACSYSSWQIMFPTAYELGFPGKPYELISDAVAVPWIVKFINKRIFDKGATSLREIGDAYNSGSFADQHVPEDYIRKLQQAYSRIENA